VLRTEAVLARDENSWAADHDLFIIDNHAQSAALSGAA
jgi:hypothetical protein